MASDNALTTLAQGLGVADHFLDQGGKRIAIAQDTQRELMEALGYPAASEAEVKRSTAQLAALRGGALPLWRVLTADAAHRFASPALAKGWRISGEDGFEATGKGADLPALAAGYYELQCGDAACFLIVAPDRCWTAPAFAQGGSRGWGLTAQVYGLRSERNFGFGDFSDVADLAEGAGRRGASFLGLSPLHALFASDRSKISPYSPSSRLFIEPLYIDAVGAPIDAETRSRLDDLRAAPLVDYRAAWAAKAPLLEALHAQFLRTNSSDFARKRAAFGEALERHATFEALSEHFAAQGLVWSGVWPEKYRDVNSDAVARFRAEHADRVAFHAWLQVVADDQLAAASARAKASGMELGLYRDLAVGADRYGSEVWCNPERYAATLSVGAPPDPLGPQGQNWGFPPFNPLTLESQRFAAFRDLVTANMRHAGAIRIDHAFQLERLFLVPEGRSAARGGYVAFPFEALLAILRVESMRNSCMVIAEDLGTGPQGFSDAIMESGILSYRILSFERTKSGGFVAPRDYPRDALAAITTHDLPTFKGWRRGFDIDLRACFGVYGEAKARDEQRGRQHDLDRWREALTAQGLSGDLGNDARARDEALIYLARSGSMLVAVQTEDILDEVNQANLPGLSEGPPNWRRRLSATVEDMAAGPLAKAGALMAQEGRSPRARESLVAGDPPRATYRLQFHAGFTFEMAREILPYIKRLGVSHVYASPIQRAKTGSTHGYDVNDPREINPELGGETAFLAFADALHELGLKLIVDIVPNHMGTGAENPFWMSLLQWGRSSPAARIFDVDFERPGADGKIILPVLGAPYGDALAKGDLSVRYDEAQGAFFLAQYEEIFPLTPPSTGVLLREIVGRLEAGSKLAVAAQRMQAAFDRLIGDDHALARAESLQNGLAALMQEERVRAAADSALEAFSADREKLNALIEAQHYRLAHWRLAASELNYRRFFEINTLAGVRVDDPRVFEITHELIFRFVDEGRIDGLRIDHIDGLADPERYLAMLQARVGPGFYVVAEKILEPGEQLKRWELAGTTGYDALNEIDGVLFNRAAREPLEGFYRDVVGETKSYEEALDEAKTFVIERSFGSEREAIVANLKTLASRDLRRRDVATPALRRAVTATLVALPVYRTYADIRGPDAADAEMIDRTIEKAQANGLPGDEGAFAWLRDVLRGEGALLNDALARQIRIGFEQLSGPVMAKGLEDTLFYRYAPFLALNEVGADPSHFGLSPADYHAAASARARDWPLSMIATATHDTKRGEDARARLFALTATPEDYVRDAERFLALATGPDRNDASIIFQALVGAWPLEALEAGTVPPPDLRERAGAFLSKALREAKRRTSWTDPDEDYEAKAQALLDAALTSGGEAFELVRRTAQRSAFAGALNGLARTILKLTSPGVPDFYQGTETWDFSFVDPDNRRPVDFDALDARLAALDLARAGELLRSWRDGRIKQFVIAKLLAARAQSPDLFAFGDYAPLTLQHGLGFERRHGDDRLVVAVHTGTDLAAGGFADDVSTLSRAFDSAQLELGGGRWRNLLTGSAFAAQGSVACAEIAEGLPWLVLGKAHD